VLPPKFVHVLENDQLLLVHPQWGRGSPLQFFFKGGSKIGLKFGGPKSQKFSTILGNFKLWPRISLERINILKITKLIDCHPSCVERKKFSELWSTNRKVQVWMLAHPKSTMRDCTLCVCWLRVTWLLPGKFQPSELTPQSDFGCRADSRWLCPKFLVFLFSHHIRNVMDWCNELT